MKAKQNLGIVILLLAALIWGCAFVAQRAGMEYVGPFTFLSMRSILGVIALLPVIFVLDTIKKKNNTYKKNTAKDTKNLILGGICCGIALTVASALQQIGMQYSDAGKGGFITALYILLVPVLGLFLKKKVRPIIWLCVIMAAFGLYLLCVTDGFKFEKGDIYLLLCALVFAVHIMTVDYFSPKTDGVKLSCIQFFTVFILSGIVMFIAETPTPENIINAWLPIAYAGVMSSAVAYTLQIIGQKYTEPTIASLMMSFESAFAVLAGIVILGEQLSPRSWLGCGVMFLAIILSLIPSKEKI